MAHTDSSLIPRIVLGVVAAIALAIPTAVTVHESRQLDLLERTAEKLDGNITGKQCQNHGTIQFSYAVNGTLHKNSGRSCGVSCDDVKVGDYLPIIYSSVRPELSRCHSLEFSRQNIFGNLFAIAVVGLVLGVVIFRVTRVDVDSNSAMDTAGYGRRST